MSTTPMTPGGLVALHARLRQLREVERPQNVRDIEEARAHGDLKENAEYHAAKERQSHIAGHIKHVESLIASSQVIDPKTLSGDRVVFGATVTLLDDDDEAVRYQIVGEFEADLNEGRISYVSPVARALIGKSAGDEVVVKSPNGNRTVLIDDVEFI